MRLARESTLMLWVAGGALPGGLLRAAVGVWLPAPWATLSVNAAGSFLIALVWMLTGPDGRLLIRPEVRFALMAGFCGGLTTFSVFSAELWLLWMEGARLFAALHLAGSLALWLGAALAGMLIGRRLNGVRS